jgi:hypothetical protein
VTGMDEHDDRTWCPSSQPDRPEAVVLGVHAGTSNGLTYLTDPAPAREAVELIPADLDPTRVVRFAGHCESICKHNSGNSCTLISKISVGAPEADERALPKCHLRPRCQWWVQVGVAACRRCPLISTVIYEDDTYMKPISDPEVSVDEITS